MFSVLLLQNSEQIKKLKDELKVSHEKYQELRLRNLATEERAESLESQQYSLTNINTSTTNNDDSSKMNLMQLEEEKAFLQAQASGQKEQYSQLKSDLASNKLEFNRLKMELARAQADLEEAR